LTIFQQRWRSKRLTKGYHAEHLGAKAFERWFLPEALPRVRSADGTGAVSSELSKWVEGREAAGGRTALRKKIAEMEQEASSPVGTLMFTEVERRIDTLVFRACFATSVWQARAFVVQGHVKINGRVVS
jgi:ribosomal protein S4